MKGFVAGTEGIAPVAASAETTVVYATPAQAQAAAEVREENYAAAVAASSARSPRRMLLIWLLWASDLCF